MSQTAHLPDWYSAESKAHKAADALDKATKDIGIALADPDTAHFLKLKRSGDVLASRVRLGTVVYEITGGLTV